MKFSEYVCLIDLTQEDSSSDSNDDEQLPVVNISRTIERYSLDHACQLFPDSYNYVTMIIVYISIELLIVCHFYAHDIVFIQLLYLAYVLLQIQSKSNIFLFNIEIV